jgi:hypothetical protein
MGGLCREYYWDWVEKVAFTEISLKQVPLSIIVLGPMGAASRNFGTTAALFDFCADGNHVIYKLSGALNYGAGSGENVWPVTDRIWGAR